MKKHIQFAQKLTTLMDSKFRLFGISFGIDPLLDIIPGFGNALGAGISCYLFWIAFELKVPSWVYGRMAWHIGVDYCFGVIPFVGFVADLFYRANTKNLALLYQFVDKDILEGIVVKP